MATEPPPMPAAPQQQKSGRSWLLIIGIIFLVFLLICGGCVTYIVINARSLAAGALEAAATEAIQSSELPQEQKERALVDIKAVSQAFGDGEITWTQFGEFFNLLSQSQFFKLVIIEAVEMEYYAKVNPDEARKAEVELVFMRFKRGYIENAIPEATFNETLNQATSQANPQVPEMKQDLTAEDLEAIVAEMEAAVEEAQITTEPYTVDYAGIFHDLVAEMFPEIAAKTEAEMAEDSTLESPPEESGDATE